MRKINNENLICRFIEKHGNRFDYSLVNHINSLTPVKIRCIKHDIIFEQLPHNHLAGKVSCLLCIKDSRSINSTLPEDDFITRSLFVHNGFYDYSLANYISAKTKVCIICPIHGEFWQTPDHHSQGEGCRKCVLDNRYLTNKQFIFKAKNIHGDLYNYSKTEYTGTRNKIIIICNIHGEFLQNAYNHLAGEGCQKCAKEALYKAVAHTTEKFIELAISVHNIRYDYSKVLYNNISSKVCIICDEHGEFWQQPNSHLKGCGCPKCNHYVSKPEKQWLNTLCIPENNRQISLRVDDKIYHPDGFDPITNTIYEFYGDYWHGNPKIYKSNDMNNAVKKCTIR